MSVPDLRRGPPRRWSESLGQIRWLPRLIDKARAAIDGKLGDYFYGQSPMDRALLRELRIGHREFARIVSNAPADGDVLAALQARSPEGVRAARIWSDALVRRHAPFLFVIDLDDGYLGRRWMPVRVPLRWGSAAFARAIKVVWPSRAVDGL
ncbi:MAG: DUF5069 domain-containing protein [Candidatus Tyrphobacter sp.]